jgi:hypothetical protein
MIPRTVEMAKAVETTFTVADLENYGNIILNGYLSTASGISIAGTAGAIDTVTFTGGSGYTNGTYPNTYLGGAVGSFGYATVTVAGGAVTGVTITAGGNNFYVGQVLTLGNIPGGTGATVTVTAVNVKEVRPALKGWTTNYMGYYTQLPPNAYGQVPGNPTMFDYVVHSFTQATGPITSVYFIAPGSGYFIGTHTGVPAVGGSGSGATLDLTVGTGGVVLSATLANPGTGYTAGDGLTVTSLGAGTGFYVTVGPIGGPSSALTVGTSGSGYTPGTYTGVTTTTNGIGSGATLDITVGASGSITDVALNAAGTNYAAKDSLVPNPATIGAGTGVAVSVASVTTAGGAGESQWAQSPRRFFQNQVSSVTPPQNVNNPQVIQYSFVYPVADNPVAPPIDSL